MSTMTVTNNFSGTGNSFDWWAFNSTGFNTPESLNFTASKVTLTEFTSPNYFGNWANSGTLVWEVGGSFTRAADGTISGTVTSVTLSDLGPTGTGPKVQLFTMTGLTATFQDLIGMHQGNLPFYQLLAGNDTLNASGFVADPSLPTLGVWLYGEGGNDTLTGTALDDWLLGGTGNDTMTGLAGNDNYKVDSLQDVIVEALNGGTDRVRSSVSYTLGANVENLKLIGITNLAGTGNALANTIDGQSGNNVLTGLGGNDVLRGAGGNDTLIGGNGKDTLNGGTGNDVFKFNLATESAVGVNRDVIQDFVRGQDKINLSAIDANSTTAGVNDAFTFSAGAAFTAVGQLYFANGILYGNTDANLATAEFQIALTGQTVLAASDFVL